MAESARSTGFDTSKPVLIIGSWRGRIDAGARLPHGWHTISDIRIARRVVGEESRVGIDSTLITQFSGENNWP